MLDFVIVDYSYDNKRIFIKPRFKLGTDIKDIMTRGNGFYAIWDFENECWSENLTRAYELIDICVNEFIEEQKKLRGPDALNGTTVYYAKYYDTGVAEAFLKYVKAQVNYSTTVPLNTKVVFKSDVPSRELYSSKRLPYDPVNMPTPNYDELMSIIYEDSERQKIEWLVGAALCGDNDKVQKFGVFYGDPGTGKGTVLDIISWIFGKRRGDSGYTAYFEAAALGRSSDQFSLEIFKNHPVVAIQADGNLSRVEDNTKLNTLISHEPMVMNEKNKGRYVTKFDTMLFMASNEPVKITNAKSGLLRRLIDIKPTGKLIDPERFKILKNNIKFEIPGIALQCMKLYDGHKDLYDGYRPMDMMAKTNDFYDFVLEYYDKFLIEEYITLSTAWEWYKKYADDSGLQFKLQRRQFALELSSYFESGPLDEWLTDDNGVRRHLSSVYRGFKKNKFKNVKSKIIDVVSKKKKDVDNCGSNDSLDGLNKEFKNEKKETKQKLPDWLMLHEVTTEEVIEGNPFNVYFDEATAQYAVIDESGKNSRPKRKWDDTKSKLKSLNTSKEHYVLTQSVNPNLIVIDFDLKDKETGEKSLERNLEAAKQFPPTYVETSKSGKGLHLHYIYEGDVNELSMLYDTDIEIKVFKGNSALRRRLMLCNTLAIAVIASGLPFKESKKKMIDTYAIEDEKHLRACIKKALRREVHANTRPSIDYIKMEIEKAYESGIKYDISDLRQAIMNFAAGSTNQSEYCMATALDLHYHSDEPTENQETKVYLEKPIAFFDWEVFKNLSILCYKVEGGELGNAGEVVRIINPTPNDVTYFFKNYRAIGFNNLEYDNDISYGRILGYSNEELYSLSQAIIKNRKDAGFRESKNLSYTDIYDFSNTKQSLKKWEIELGIKHQEFPLKWDQPVPEDMWKLAGDYCANDVCAEEIVFYHLKADWEARQFLSKISGLTVNDKTNAHSTRIIFGKNRNPQSEFNYPDLSKEFPGYEFSKFGLDKEKYNKDEKGKPIYSTGKSIFMGEDPSEGGYVSYTVGFHENVALLDIASLHPSTIKALNLFGPYTKKFIELLEARVAIKHKDWEKARGYLNGALCPFIEGAESLSEDEQQDLADGLAYALKIVINSIYGLTSASFPNAFKDPRNVDNVVAKRGALFMIALKHEVLKRGFTVAHIKTDSIKIPNATEEIIKFVMDFGKKYGYSFEHEATYEKMCLVNKSTYIAKYDEFGERTKGGKHANQWTATGAEFQHPYIFKTLFSHEPITFNDYCETKSVSGGAAMYLDFNEKLIEKPEDELYSLKRELENASKGKMELRREIKLKQEEIDSIHNLSFVGKCGLFVPVMKGCGGGYLLRVDEEGKAGSISGTKGYRWMESEYIKENGLEKIIDMEYYRKLVDDAYEHIETYCDANEFINS